MELFFITKLITLKIIFIKLFKNIKKNSGNLTKTLVE